MTKPYQSNGEFCPARPERCPAALVADSRPREGQPDEVRVIDRTGHSTSACLLHGAVLLASLEGGRVFPGYGGHASAIDVHRRAREMRPFDGVWTGPGVQRVSTFAEAAVFPSAPDLSPACLHSRSSGLGNAPRAPWLPGQRYQAGHAIVADAGMISDANTRAIEAVGLSFILGARIPDVPYVVAAWRQDHPDRQIPDGHIFTQPWPAGPADKRRDQTIYYQYRADRARRTLHGIDEQVTKAEKAVEGKAAVKRNRFINLTGATKSVNRDLEAKARALAGLKGYVTNLPEVTAEFVIDAYHRLFQTEKSFRMSKHDLQARPIYHHKRASIDAHLTIVFAALAISRWIEQTTGWSIKRFVRTTRRYRTIQIQAGTHALTAADPLPNDLRSALASIHSRAGDAH